MGVPSVSGPRDLHSTAKHPQFQRPALGDPSAPHLYGPRPATVARLGADRSVVTHPGEFLREGCNVFDGDCGGSSATTSIPGPDRSDALTIYMPAKGSRRVTCCRGPRSPPGWIG